MRATLITPSYHRDFEACRFLCETADQFLDPEIDHLLIVPNADKKLFAPLQSARRTLVAQEDLLPRWMKQVPGLRRPWRITPFSLPVRGWIAQQMIKLASDWACDSEIFLFADSDVAFVRPVAAATFIQGDAVRLYHRSGVAQLASHARWNRAAAELLGLPPQDYFGADFICQLASWRRSVLLDMRSRIERTARTSWQGCLCRQWHFSEYVLYGVFAVHGREQPDPRIFLSDVDVSHSSWHYDLGTEAGVTDYIARFAPHHVAVHLQSTLDLDVETRRKIVAACAAKYRE